MANAEKAKQDAITAEEQGKAKIAEAKAQAEVAKITAVVEAQKKAEVAKLEAEQAKYEAQKIAEKGKAEAEAIQAKAEAEAAGILKKAEAMKQYGDAARQQMELDTLKVYFEQLPKIAEAVAKGYMNVDSIKMFGGDSSKLAGDIMTTVTQVTDGIKESTGLDINEMLAKGFAKEKAEDTKPVEKNDTGNDYQEV